MARPVEERVVGVTPRTVMTILGLVIGTAVLLWLAWLTRGVLVWLGWRTLRRHLPDGEALPLSPALTTVVAAFAVLFAVGIWWGWPALWAPDELDPPAILHAIGERFANGWFDKYPPLHYYLVSLVYAPALVAGWLGWLHVGRVPLLALIVVFLGAFAIIGFAVNIVLHGLLGIYAPAILSAPLAVFHPAVRDWFSAAFEAPTRPQRLGWPAIARGESTLILAPTGSGKTLTAFLWCLNRLLFEVRHSSDLRERVISNLYQVAREYDLNATQRRAAEELISVGKGGLVSEHVAPLVAAGAHPLQALMSLHVIFSMSHQARPVATSGTTH